MAIFNSYLTNYQRVIYKPQTVVELGGTIKKYQMKWLLEEYPPNKPWFINPGLTLLLPWNHRRFIKKKKNYIPTDPSGKVTLRELERSNIFDG